MSDADNEPVTSLRLLRGVPGPAAGPLANAPGLNEALLTLAPRGIPSRTALLDIWYAITYLFKGLLANQKIFYGPLKTRFKRLGATAWPTTPAANGPANPSGAWPGRVRTWCRAKRARARPWARIRS